MKNLLKLCLSLGAAIALSAIPTQAASINVPSDLVAWWTGDGNARDYSGYGNHGTLNNGTGYSSAYVGNGFSMDGNDDNVSAPTSSSLQVESFTILAWVRPESVDAQPIVEFADENDYAGVHLWIGAQNGGTLSSSLQANVRENAGGGANRDLMVTDVISLNTWYHVGLTYNDSTGRIDLWLNGTSVANANYGPLDPATSHRVLIGHRPNTSLDDLNGSNFDGLIDEVQIFGRALSSTEISNIYGASTDGCNRATYSVSLPGQSGGNGGFQLVAYSLQPSTVDAVFPSPTSGDQISFWTPSTASYTTYTYSSGWSGGAGSFTLSPSDAFYYRNATSSARTLDFYGIPPTSSVGVSMSSSFDYVLGAGHPGLLVGGSSGNEVACGSLAKSLGWSPNDGDQVFIFNSSTQNYATHTYDVLGGVGSWSPAVPVLGVGLGAYFSPAASKTWTQVVGGTSCP